MPYRLESLCQDALTDDLPLKLVKFDIKVAAFWKFCDGDRIFFAKRRKRFKALHKNIDLCPAGREVCVTMLLLMSHLPLT